MHALKLSEQLESVHIKNIITKLPQSHLIFLLFVFLTSFQNFIEVRSVRIISTFICLRTLVIVHHDNLSSFKTILIAHMIMLQNKARAFL